MGAFVCISYIFLNSFYSVSYAMGLKEFGRCSWAIWVPVSHETSRCGSGVVYSLFIIAPIVCGGCVFRNAVLPGPRQYFLAFISLSSF